MFVGFQRHQCSPPPPHDATILNCLNDREKGRHYFLYDFDAPPPPPSPDATIFDYLYYDRERGGRQLQYPVVLF